MKTILWQLMAGLACLAPVWGRAQTTAGVISTAEVWSGTVTLTGDVRIGEGGQVTLQPGTVVRAQPRVDGQQAGEQPDRIEIRVEGGVLLAEGTAAEPIVFTSAGAAPAPGDWTGLVIRYGTAVLRHVHEDYAHIGLNVLGGGDYVWSDTVWNRNESHGVRLGASGAYEFTGLTANGNGSTGLSAGAATTVNLSDGVFEDNAGEAGMVLPASSILDRVRVARSGSTGVAIFGGGGTHRWRAVAISDSGADGIYAIQFRQLSLTDCQLVRNQRWGLYGSDGSLIEADGCRVLSNRADGFICWRVPTVRFNGGELRLNAAAGLQADGATEVRNTIVSGNGAGLVLGANVSIPGQSVVVGCTVTANAQEGIAIARPGKVEACDVRSNGVGVDVRWGDRTGVFEVIGNDLIGNPGGDLKNTGTCAAIARANYFGVTTTQQLQAGEVNPTRIHGSLDDPAAGQVLVPTFLTSSKTNANPGLQAFVLPPLAGASFTLSGTVVGAQVWSGTVYLTGDVEIPDGASVSVQPGTRIVASPRRDDQAAGLDTSRVELIVRGGTLTMAGLTDQVVSLTSAASAPAPGDWFGLVVRFGSVTAQHTREEFGRDGLSVLGGGDFVWQDTAWNRNSERGVRIAFQGQHEFNRLAALGNASGGLLSELATARVVITDGEFSQNAVNGEPVIQLSGSSFLTRLRLERNGGTGLWIPGSGGSHQWEDVSVTDCQSGTAAIYVQGFDQLSMFRGTVLRNPAQGMVVFGGNRALLEDCRFEANGGDGFQGSNLGSVEASGSTFRFNAGSGLLSDGGLRVANSVFSSNGSGIVSRYSPNFGAMTASIEGCQVNGSAGVGIILDRDGAVKSCILRNNAVGLSLGWGQADGVVEVTDCDLLGNPEAEVRVISLASAVAEGCYWGSVTTAELTQGRENLSRIWDRRDNPEVGSVTITNWRTSSITATELSISGQPQSLTVNAGATAVFAVTATGPEPLTYQWRRGSTDLTDDGRITGATSRELRVQAVTAGDAGEYTVLVTGGGSGLRSATALLTVQVPNQPPSVALTSPAAGSRFTAPAEIPLTVLASDPDDGIARVEYFAGGVRLGESTVAPFSYLWQAAPVGVHSLVARATDRSGASTSSTPVEISISAPNQPPTVTLSAPAEGATFTTPATISLTAVATDADDGVAKVEFFAGGERIGEATAAPYVLAWSGAPVGTHLLTAKATDRGGASTVSLPVTVTVRAPDGDAPPTISPIGYQRIKEGDSSGWIAFHVADDHTPADQLVVRARSSRQEAVPDDWVLLAGSGSNRLVSVRFRPEAVGPVNVTLSVTDAAGQTTEARFTVERCPCETSNLGVNLYAMVTLRGIVGRTYDVRYSDDGKVTWNTLASIMLLESPQRFMDVSAPAPNQRAYEVVPVP